MEVQKEILRGKQKLCSDAVQTKETEIEAHVVIDGKGQSNINTGIGFLDHIGLLIS